MTTKYLLALISSSSYTSTSSNRISMRKRILRNCKYEPVFPTWARDGKKIQIPTQTNTKEGYASDKCLWAYPILALPENITRCKIPHYAEKYLKNWSASKTWPTACITSVCRETGSDNCFSTDTLMAILCPVPSTHVSFRLKPDTQHHPSSPYHFQHWLNLKIWLILALEYITACNLAGGLDGTISSPHHRSSDPANKARGRNCSLTCGGPVKSSRLGWKVLEPDASPWLLKSAWCCRAVVHCL